MNASAPAHWTDRLSEYLDGDLSPAEHAACEAHLAGCADCAETLAGLRAVQAHARALPVMPPARDLWKGIEARLGARVLGLGAAPRESSRRQARGPARRWSLSFGQLAAAAAALVAVTALVVWFAVERGGAGRQTLASRAPAVVAPGAPASGAGPAATPAAPESGASSAPAPQLAARPSGPGEPAAPADFGVTRYDTAIAELESALQKQRGRLDPRTVQVVEQNLALIDKAIADARAALAADPASPYLNTHLASTMRRKVELLRRVNELAGTRI